MLRKLVFVFIALAAAGGVVLSLLTIPLLRRLPQQSRVSMDGITTLDDAVQACQRTNLHGWELVAYAQHLVARKFTYSRLNTWDTPARAFERGVGYCEQQALALKYIYDRSGIKSRPVFALRCTFPAKEIDGIPWQGVDLLIVGCPTQGFRPTPAMQTFLGTVSYQRLRGMAIACFDTRFRGRLWKSSAAPRMARQLSTMGVELVVPPESFFVKALKKEGPLLAGEVERAATWARMLFTKAEASHLSKGALS